MLGFGSVESTVPLLSKSQAYPAIVPSLSMEPAELNATGSGALKPVGVKFATATGTWLATVATDTVVDADDLIEEVVGELDGVLECACVGVPDAKTGEAIKLVIIKKDPALTEAQVRAWCKDKLTGYKQPRLIEFRAELPKTPVGKILRRELRDK